MIEYYQQKLIKIDFVYYKYNSLKIFLRPTFNWKMSYLLFKNVKLFLFFNANKI